MAFLAKVIKVLISGPGDVSVDIDKVKKAIYEWNSINSGSTGIIFLPLHWKTNTAPKLGIGGPQPIINKQLTEKADYVIALFRSRIGTETESYISGTVEEIFEVKKAGKMVSVYFIDDKAKISELDINQVQKLNEFKKDVEGLYADFENIDELVSDLKQHLTIQINTDSYFSELEVSKDEGIQIQFSSSSPDTKTFELSNQESILIIEASYDKDGSILVVSSNDGLSISTNRRELLNAGRGRDRAKWEKSIDKLVELGFIISININNTIYNLTEKGYEYAEEHDPYISLSRDSKLLLESAVENSGHIFITRVSTGEIIETVEKEFSTGNDSKESAHWLSIIEELEFNDLIKYEKTDCYKVSKNGYDLIDRIKYSLNN